MNNTQLICNKILSMADLNEMNKAEIKSRKYRYCTIENNYGDEFIAQVAYSETSEAWEPTNVLFGDDWVAIADFENSEEGASYSCKDYRVDI